MKRRICAYKSMIPFAPLGIMKTYTSASLRSRTLSKNPAGYTFLGCGFALCWEALTVMTNHDCITKFPAKSKHQSASLGTEGSTPISRGSISVPQRLLCS